MDPKYTTDHYENVGPGSYNPKYRMLSKNRNAKSIVDWSTFENR